MSGGGYGQQQWGGQSGGNMYGTPDGFGGGKGYSLTGSQPWQNMATTNPVGQPSPMEQAFAPSSGMGGPMTGTPYDAPQGVAGPAGGNNVGGTMGSPWGGQAGGNMGSPVDSAYGSGGDMRRELGFQQPIAAQGVLNDAMMRAGGKMGTTVNPLTGMATTNPVYGESMGGGMGGPMSTDVRTTGGGMGGTMPTGSSRYQDYMNRRNSWIDQLRGYVSPPPQPTWGGQPGPGQPPVTAVPPGGPAPAPKAAGGGVDHMANLRTLMGQDPRLANEYRLRNGDTLGWWQQNQGNVAQGLFGGDQGKMQEWIRSTSPVSSNASPLTQEEMMRLNQMAGIRGPSWLK